MRRVFVTLALGLVACSVSCSEGTGAGPDVAVPGRNGATKSAATVRATRRAFDGAPPVIPHVPIGAECAACHNDRGLEVDGLGFAPPSPHARTGGLSAMSRCTQCHVYRQTDSLFVDSAFRGLVQDLRAGTRLNELAPPVMPHDVFMRENCQACHTGPAAREEIRTSHPERENCTQCHVPRVTQATFER